MDNTHDDPRSAFGTLVFLVVAGLGVAADLLTKTWAFDRIGLPWNDGTLWVWHGVLCFKTSLNEGALFGMGQGQVNTFVVLSFLALAAILYWVFLAGANRDWVMSLALGSVTAGTLGNLYDRLGMHQLVWSDLVPHHQAGERVYAVRDWIYFVLIDWPIFNLADSFLVFGAILLIAHALFFADNSDEKTA